ncbi:SCO2523 family variant P-loop protein [Nocardia sp. XZ_19_385]|uniref:SCO2523 family variant P-loop protein n=1 Tax=Nocardia sp. XZ_19_385 TaxID=2769488 RepID=UPI001E347DD6|nr:SCO2523 family variant P-loop protein [Nocardia sp. XZ_19_385]
MRLRGSEPVLVFATSDKGGTGRSVTSCNIAYRLHLRGHDVAYVDFDFGSPTAGALFEIGCAVRGVTEGRGMHSYLLDQVGEASRLDVTRTTDRPVLRRVPPGAGKLVLFPGDEGGAEFTRCDDAMVARVGVFLSSLLREFSVVMVDLSAGRSIALELALRATASNMLRHQPHRWLVFHRWTHQHVLAAGGLMHGSHGLIKTGSEWGHDRDALLAATRCVRTAVPSAARTRTAGRPSQATWLDEQAIALRELAIANGIGAAMVLGQTPIEPMLQWREQLILDADVNAGLANESTVEAYIQLARRLTDTSTWDLE